MIGDAEEFTPERGACVLAGEVTTMIDTGSNITERVHGISILKVPQGLSPEQYELKFAAISDHFYALEVTQKCILKSTLIGYFLIYVGPCGNSMQALGVPTPERTFVAHTECEVIWFRR